MKDGSGVPEVELEESAEKTGGLQSSEAMEISCGMGPDCQPPENMRWTIVSKIHRKNEDHSEMDDSVRTLADLDQDVDMVDEALERRDRRVRLRPRDGYNGVLDLPKTKKRHTTAVKTLAHAKLKELVQVFIMNRGFVDEFSHTSTRVTEASTWALARNRSSPLQANRVSGCIGSMFVATGLGSVIWLS